MQGQYETRYALQYRGRLMPVLNLSGAQCALDKPVQPVLVLHTQGHPMAVMVDEIIDVVEETLKIELNSDRLGILGTAVLSGRVCDIIDSAYYQLLGLAEHVKAEGYAYTDNIDTRTNTETLERHVA
jgi:two-component system chemotaxis sensor kinase CheA